MKNINHLSKNQKTLSQKSFQQMMTSTFVKSIIYGRFIIFVLAVIAQLLLFFFILYKNFVLPIGNYFFIASIILSISFALYLVNKSGKNEYKLAWIVPTIFTPVFSIGLYILFQIDLHKKRLYNVEQEVAEKAMSHLKQAQITDSFTCAETDRFDIVKYLEYSGKFLPYTKSKVEYYDSGEKCFTEILAEISKAKKFIFIEIFIMNHGYMLETLLDALIKKQKEGVEIRILYDGFGSIAMPPKHYEKYLNLLGIKGRVFMPIIPIFLPHQFNRDHRKFFIVDNQVGFTGGINISDEYINKCDRLGYWKDTMIKVTGPAVSAMTSIFLTSWNMTEKTVEDISAYFLAAPPIPNADGIVVPYADDLYNKQDIAENVFCAMLDHARYQVQISTPYLVINNRLLHSITFAARRGVKVSIVVPERADHFITFCIGRTFVKKLIEKDVHIYAYKPGFIHAKMMTVDSTCAVVGSINFDYRSLNNQFEGAVYIVNQKVIADIENDFQKIIFDSEEITLEKYKKIPLIQRVIGCIFKILAPLV